MPPDDLSSYRRLVGFVFQSFYLLPRLTAVENVALPVMLSGVDKVTRRQRAKILLDRVGLGDRSRCYPSQLSGAQQQHRAMFYLVVKHFLDSAFSVVRVIGPVDNFLVARALRLDARRSAAIGRSRPSFP